jgi:UDP-N-acetylmuramate dehydrogenase
MGKCFARRIRKTAQKIWKERRMNRPLNAPLESCDLPEIKGSYRFDAALGAKGWFKTGGCADVMVCPEDSADLQAFLKAYPADLPLHIFGVASNTIIRDGGVSGVTIKLNRAFNYIEREGADKLRCGALALDMNVAQKAAQFGLSGLSFLSGIPGTIGGALKMNAGAYGREVVDCLECLRGIDRDGNMHELSVDDMRYTYRHSAPDQQLIFVEAVFNATAGDPEIIKGEIADIRAKREASQPIKEKTGGSTFANPSAADLQAAGLDPSWGAWRLIDAVDGRGFTIGGAQMSEKHCNFMINAGDASAFDLECLGEEMRRRVFEKFGITLRWEIRRIGRYGEGQAPLYNWID